MPLGLLASLIFWTLESVLHVYVFHVGTSLIREFFNPGYHELAMRLTIVSLFLFFAFYARFSVINIRRAKEKLEDAHAELNQIFNVAADGMRVVDHNFNVSRTNRTFAKLAGMDVKKMKNKKCYEIFPGDDCHTSQCPLTQIVKYKRPRVEHDIRKIRRDGREVYCIVTAVPFLDSNGRVLGIVEDFKDITSRREMEKELKDKLEKLEKFQKVATGRELRMIELKKTIKDLKKEIEKLPQETDNHVA